MKTGRLWLVVKFSQLQDLDVIVLQEVVNDAISSCPRGKVGGDDNLQYEQLIVALYLLF
jgi:hypothetical protein